MAKLHSTLCALGAFSITAVLAQQPGPIAPPAVPPVAPAPATGTTPAPIEPPINLPLVPPPPPPASDLAPNSGLAPTATRLNEFQGDEVSLVLRTLARQARINIVVSDKVAATAGPVTMRIEDKTPLE